MSNPIQERFQNGNMFTQFQQFAQNFQGDARAQVYQLLNSGRMTQDQFNQLSNMANQFRMMFGRR